MYTLVTPSVLVGDLACRPRGQRLLRLLEEVLLLDAAALPALGDAVLRADLGALAAAREAALTQMQDAIGTLSDGYSRALDAAETARAEQLPHPHARGSCWGRRVATR